MRKVKHFSFHFKSEKALKERFEMHKYPTTTSRVPEQQHLFQIFAQLLFLSLQRCILEPMMNILITNHQYP